MRIIAGRFRSRKLLSVPGDETRPTPDRLRESLFSIIAPRLPGVIFLDAFAGTGSVGFEALSRGAGHVIFLENRAPALRALRDNAAGLQVENEITIVHGAAALTLPGQACQIAFLDPPYDKTREYALCLDILAGSECELVLAQHTSRLELPEQFGRLRRYRVLKQGDNSITFFAPTFFTPRAPE